MFNSRYRACYILLIALYSYANTLFSEVYRYYGIAAPWYGLIPLMMVWTALIWEGDRMIEWTLNKNRPGQDLVRKLVTFFFLSLAFSAVVSLALILAAEKWVFLQPPGRSWIILKLGLTLGTRINLFLQVVNVIFFFSNRYRDKLVEAEAAKRAITQAQLQAIRSQVNPHFLFNNLNVLASLVIRDNPEANRFIEEFATVYRHVLHSEQKELVELREELDFIRHYIFLLNTRFPESIVFEIRIDPAYEAFYVVPVALQMLVENAIKHNIASKTHPLTIKIFVDAHAGLVVENNLQRKPVAEEGKQIGLNNIRQRYELVGQRNMVVQRGTDFFSVTLPLIQPNL